MSPLIKFNLALIALLAVIDVVWSQLAGFELPALIKFRGAVVFCAIFAAFGTVYTLWRPNRKIAGPCWSLFTYFAFLPAGILFSYLMASLGLPLIDRHLAAFDAWLGFDWLATIEALAKLPSWVGAYSGKLYNSSFVAMILVALYLTLRGQTRRLDEFVTLFILTGTATAAIAGLLPAAGAYAHFAPPFELFDRLKPGAGYTYLEHFYAIRDGSMRQLPLTDSQGIVTFPSFHTAVSLILIYVMRRTGPWFLPVVIWNLGIIATTPFDGAHYIADVLGGALVTAGAIAFVRWLEPRLARFFAGLNVRAPVAALRSARLHEDEARARA